VLLGLGTVGLVDAFPHGVSLPAAEALLGLLVYYLRVVLFVMVLSQYFMATLGAEFSRLKWLGHRLHARSIGADVAADIAPELQLRMRHLARRIQGWKGRLARCSTRAVVMPATPAHFTPWPAYVGTSCSSIGSSKEALQLIRACMPELDYSNNTEQRTDRKLAVKVLGRKLDLPALQQLLLQLAVDSKDEGQQQQQQRTLAGGKAATAVHFDLEAAGGAEGVVDAGAAAAAAAVAAALLGSLRGTAIRDIGPVSSTDKVRDRLAGHCIRQDVCSPGQLLWLLDKMRQNSAGLPSWLLSGVPVHLLQ
jgi:hypothetical protein